jgi:hypothetical protein
MKVVIRFSQSEEAKALPILLRHTPGMILPNRTYVLGEDAVKSLHEAGIEFAEVSREASTPSLDGAAAGERI